MAETAAIVQAAAALHGVAGLGGRHAHVPLEGTEQVGHVNRAWAYDGVWNLNCQQAKDMRPCCTHQHGGFAGAAQLPQIVGILLQLSSGASHARCWPSSARSSASARKVMDGGDVAHVVVACTARMRQGNFGEWVMLAGAVGGGLAGAYGSRPYCGPGGLAGLRQPIKTQRKKRTCVHNQRLDFGAAASPATAAFPILQTQELTMAVRLLVVLQCCLLPRRPATPLLALSASGGCCHHLSACFQEEAAPGRCARSQAGDRG